MYQEDCVHLMDQMPDNFIDLVVTSPPYDDLRTYDDKSNFDFQRTINKLKRVMKPGGVVVWVVGDKTKNGYESGTSFRQALYFKKIGFKLFDTMIYMKSYRGAIGSNRSYRQRFEYMFVFSMGETPKSINLIRDHAVTTYRKSGNPSNRNKDGSIVKWKSTGRIKGDKVVRGNIWRYPTGYMTTTKDKYAFGHPAMFPEKLAEDHILSWSNPGDLVFDPFTGSGTTLKMAILNDRKFIGSEINPEYCRIAETRINNIIKN